MSWQRRSRTFGPPLFPLPLARLRRKLLRLSRGLRRFGEGPDLLDRADADAVGLAEGAIYRPGFCDPHFGAVDERRDVGRIGISITNEPATTSRFVNSSSERVSAICLI